MLELALWWFGCGLCTGLVVMNYLWRAKVREKAANGLRLEINGRLYNVSNAHSADCKP